MRHWMSGNPHILESYWRRLLIADAVVVLLAIGLAWGLSDRPRPWPGPRSLYFDRGVMVGSGQFTFVHGIHYEPVPSGGCFPLYRVRSHAVGCWIGGRISCSPCPPQVGVEIPENIVVTTTEIAVPVTLDSCDWELPPSYPLEPVDFFDL